MAGMKLVIDHHYQNNKFKAFQLSANKTYSNDRSDRANESSSKLGSRIKGTVMTYDNDSSGLYGDYDSLLENNERFYPFDQD